MNSESSVEARVLPHVNQAASENVLSDAGSSTLGSVTAARGDGVEMGGRFKRKGTMYAYLWLIHADIWQKPTQYCKAIIL